MTTTPDSRGHSDDMSPDADDEDSVLDELQEVVELALGEDLAPEEPESRWERRQRILDSWTAIILAVAAVATAWATFQASQWSGAQSEAQSVSAIARADAGREATEATQQTIVDSQMWLSWLGAVDSKASVKAAFLEHRFSPSLKVAQKVWLTGVSVDAQGTPVVVPPGTPLDLPEYVVPAQVRSNHDSTVAEAQLAYGDKAGAISTDYVMLAVLFALVLFFASVALKFSGPKVQVLLTLLAIALLLTTGLRMLLLPQYLTGRPDGPPTVAMEHHDSPKMRGLFATQGA